jgi:multiple sugar transport system substrate-binding protein
MATIHDQRPRTFSRRQALKLAGAAGATGLAGRALPVLARQASTPATDGKVLAESGPIKIIETGARLPTDNVTFQWMDSGDSKATFWKKFFALYHQAHPNVEVNYQGIPGPDINRLVSIGVQSGNAPDVFQTPPNITPAQMVAEGWIQPLDDYIPDFDAWKTRYPPGVLLEGVTMFNGKVYAFPYLSNRQYGTLTLYNKDYMAKAGYDPTSKPLTWTDFRDAAKKMTGQGKGKYYGLVFAGAVTGRWGGTVAALASMAGAMGGERNWKTGELNYTTDQFVAAVELLLAMKSDGSFFPGSLQFNNPQTEARLPQGVAGMCLQGPWNIPQWMRNDPDFNFGVGSQPVPDSGDALPMGVGPGAFIPPWLFAKSKHPEIAGDIFAYLSTFDGQTAFALAAQGFPPPILPEAQKAGAAAGLDPKVLFAYDLFDKQLRVEPSPAARNPDVAQVLLETKPITPDLGETVQGLFTGQLKDVKKALQDVKDRAHHEHERAIKAAQAKGAKVTADDWVFPNWDPTKDYTDADYKALKG